MLISKQVLAHYPNGPQEKERFGISLSERRESFNLGDKSIAYGSESYLGVYIKPAFGLLTAFFKFF